jgi:serine/threonine-protein kinase mTOR
MRHIEARIDRIPSYSPANTFTELPASQFTIHYTEVTLRISQLVVQSSDTNERIGGIHALNALIDFKGDDAGQKTTRFASYLRAVLRGNDTAAMIVAARALGRLATPGGTLTAELVEAEVKTALEHLQIDRQENRRFAAVLILRELARNSPTLLFVWVPQILEVIWIALRDQKIMIRESAAEAVSACVEIMSARDTEVRSKWLGRLYDEAFKGAQSSSSETIHGSLLALKELLLKGGMYMQGLRYRETCELVMRYKDHRDSMIRREVVTMIPILAAYTPPEFTNNYLHQCMLHLQGQLKRDKERSQAFVAVGKVASAVGSSIAPYLESILSYIKEGLAMKA